MGIVIRRRKDLMMIVGALAVCLASFATPAHAQDEGQSITSPPSQTTITEGVPLTVEGVNCPANGEVQLRGPLSDIITTTTADGNGDFSVDVLLPVGAYERPATETLEQRESVITGTCGGSEPFAVVVVIGLAEDVVDDDPDTGQVAQIPVGGVQAGAGGTAAEDGIASWVVLGSTLAAGAAMVVAWRRRGAGPPVR